jgi:hypothetical protein
MGALMENQARLAAMEAENSALKEEIASLKGGGNSTPTNGSELGVSGVPGKWTWAHIGDTQAGKQCEGVGV